MTEEKQELKAAAEQPESINPDSPWEIKEVKVSRHAYNQYVQACMLQALLYSTNDLYEEDYNRLRDRPITEIERIRFRAKYKNNARFEKEMHKAHDETLSNFRKEHLSFTRRLQSKIDQLIGAMTEQEKEVWKHTSDAVFTCAQNVIAAKDRTLAVTLLRMMNDNKFDSLPEALKEDAKEVSNG